MPAAQRGWVRAMRAELDHIDGSAEGLRWALGCPVMCYQQRMRLMNRTQLQVSNWVMGAESLLCFGPLTLLWIVAVSNFGPLSAEPKTLVAVALATAAPIALLFGRGFWFRIDWGLFALLSALPALCCWHLSMQSTK